MLRALQQKHKGYRNGAHGIAQRDEAEEWQALAQAAPGKEMA
ncbi:hypothetical protein [Hymenobacter latericus]|nr:hypothetical protein [Hymenobacter sp. YIM 151858-1]UYZ59066.1 hypothetical protein OIS50_18650 [Hymenobacter sp. YIM 151858-1]